MGKLDSLPGTLSSQDHLHTVWQCSAWRGLIHCLYSLPHDLLLVSACHMTFCTQSGSARHGKVGFTCLVLSYHKTFPTESGSALHGEDGNIAWHVKSGRLLPYDLFHTIKLCSAWEGWIHCLLKPHDLLLAPSCHMTFCTQSGSARHGEVRNHARHVKSGTLSSQS